MTHITERSAPSRPRVKGQRAFDMALASAALLITLPASLVVALAIMLESGGPVLYRGWRVGRDGEIFRIYKFRSMVANADRAGSALTTAGDSRVTRVGRALRRTKLDELPQLLNVLRGEMGIVGPRPEHPNYVRLYTEEQRRVLDVLPGITGAASLRYRNEERLLNGENPEVLYRAVIMPEKLRLELEYMERRSFWTDLGLIWETMAVVPNRLRRVVASAMVIGRNGISRNAISHPPAGSSRRYR